jgi:site-specific DNA-methyltransferase (adenine-specific)
VELRLENKDCMEIMKGYSDKYFDLAVVDPPYGIGADIKNNGKNSDRHEKTALAKINTYNHTKWDSNIPNQDYFNELFRISNNQIIFGANYFGLIGGYIFWDKNVTMPTYSDGELAYCSLINSVKKIEITWHGMLQQDMKNKEHRIHPTQKPIKLYEWIYNNYAKTEYKVIDTHLGSGSNLIAADKFGISEFVGCELDKDYFEAMKKRYELFKSQTKLF